VKSSYEELSALEDTLDGADAATLARWENANRRYHEALVSACGSPWLIRLRGMLHRHAERYRMISLAHATAERDVHDEHEAIFDAAITRKTLRACRLIEVHLQRTTDAVRAALERRSDSAARSGTRVTRGRVAGAARSGSSVRRRP
jgi:GntR family transcriptional regulator, carbon starvation induced regulator